MKGRRKQTNREERGERREERKRQGKKRDEDRADRAECNGLNRNTWNECKISSMR